MEPNASGSHDAGPTAQDDLSPVVSSYSTSRKHALYSTTKLFTRTLDLPYILLIPESPE